MKALMLSSVFVVLTIQTSTAAWVTKSEGPDVFGDTTVTAINVNLDGRGLVITCNQADQLTLAFIEKAATANDIPETQATVLFQIDGGAPQSLDAVLRAWNDKFAGVIAAGRSDNSVAIARALSAARKKINVGIKIGDQRESESFDTANSAQVAKALEQDCKFAPPAPQRR